MRKIFKAWWVVPVITGLALAGATIATGFMPSLSSEFFVYTEAGEYGFIRMFHGASIAFWPHLLFVITHPFAGFLLLCLVMAWIFRGKFLRSFLASSIFIVTTLTAFYITVIILTTNDIRQVHQPLPIMRHLIDTTTPWNLRLLGWDYFMDNRWMSTITERMLLMPIMFIGFCAMAAGAVWLVGKAWTKWQIWWIFIAAYAGIFTLFKGIRWNWFDGISLVGTERSAYQTIGGMDVITLYPFIPSTAATEIAIALATVLFAMGLYSALKSRKVV